MAIIKIKNPAIDLDVAEIPNLDASKITTGSFDASRIGSGTFDDARIAASNVSQHATSFDDNKIVNDISTLALRQASDQNKSAYNTNSQSVDVFQDATGIDTTTNAQRNASEYVSSNVESTVAYTSDNNTLLLLHGDGSDNGTSIIDSSSYSRTVTRRNSPVTKTSIKKIGTSSIYLGDGDGTSGSHGNALSLADSDNWHFSDNSFTIETWIYLTSLPSSSGNSQFEIFGQATSNTSDSGGAFHFTIQSTGAINCNAYYRNGSNSSEDFAFNTGANTISTNTWTHLALTAQRTSTNTLRIYKDGVQIATQAVPSNNNYRVVWNNLGGDAWISKRAYNDNYGYIRGYIDEYRISNVCRYPDGTTFTPNLGTILNATGNFTGTTITAPSSVSEMGAIITYQDQAGTNALNTDIVLQLSADGGSNYSTATLTALPDFATGIKMAKVNDLAVTAGTSLKYKISFANQASGTKEARIRGVALQY